MIIFYPTSNKLVEVPFFSLEETHKVCKSELILAFEQVLTSERFVLGERLSDFEKKFAAYIEVNHCIGTKSGLDALQLCFRALGIGPGDEVIVPAHTFISSVFSVMNVGASPVLAEPDPTTYNVTAETIAPCITNKTKAIMPVHLYGQACQMDGILQLARKNGLKVIEDNAQSHGANFGGQKTGSFGHANATSFYPGKNLGALGDAGAVTTQDLAIDEKIRAIRNVGITAPFEHSFQGMNSRLDEIQASFLSIKLDFLEARTEQRQQNANFYTTSLKDIEKLVLPEVAEGASHVFHLFVIRTEQRNELARFLKSKNIGTHMHYPIPIHLQPACQHLGYEKGSLPMTEEISRTCLSLPVYPGLTEPQLSYVAENIQSFFATY